MKITATVLFFFLLTNFLFAQEKVTANKIALLKDSLELKKKELLADDLQLGLAYFDLAFATYQDLNPKEITKESYLSAIRIFEKKNPLPKELGICWMNLGSWYLDADNLRKAESTLQKGRVFYEKNFPKETSQLANILMNIGTVALRRNDDMAALHYYEKSLQLFVKTYGENAIENNDVLNNLAIIKENLDDYETAKKINFQILKNAQTHYGEQSLEVAKIYETIGNMYSTMPGDHLKTALEYLKKGLTLRQQLSKGKTPSMAVNALFQGEIYARQKNQEKASEYLEKSRQMMLNFVNKKHLFIAASYYYEAFAYEKEKAKKCYLRALECLDYDPNNLDKLSSFTKGADLHFNFANMYSLWYEDTGNAEYLWKAQEKFDAALRLMNMARNDFKEPQNADIFLGRFRKGFENLFINYYLLAEKTGDQKHLESLFFWMDKIKNSILTETVKSNKDVTFSGVSDDILNSIKLYQDSLTDLNYELFKLSSDESSAAVIQLKGNIASTKEAYLKTIETVKKTHPQYFNLQFNDDGIDLKTVQKELLTDNAAAIEFFLSDSLIFRFAIQKNDFQVDTFVIDKPLMDCLNILSNFQQKKEGQTVSFSDKNFLKAAHYFYQRILVDFLKTVPENSILTIVPDGKLNYLPFEFLLKNAPNTTTNFANADYLQNHYQINYAYSFNLLKEQQNMQNKPSHFFAGFAPTYHPKNINEADTIHQPLYAAVVRGGELPLLYAREEVEKIAALTNGSAYLGDAATKELFLQKAADFRILHLSMHALIDNKNPLFSRLIFSQQNTDNQLLASDLYYQNLNADLVVLSACNSGNGKYSKGEGIMSLSRAFAYTGVPATVMSLWKVPDEATSKIMVAFYENLQKGERKDAALRQAKMQYLENVIDPKLAHPVYWAGFVAVGDMAGMEFEHDKGRTWLLLVAGICMILLVIFLKKKF